MNSTDPITRGTPVMDAPVDAVPVAPSVPFRLDHGAEIVPGYVLQERIGSGGYGEVWSAMAPGGLVKAVKFVYGRLEENRASRELKSLNHVKGLRHPFLMTLERIEVVDGRLVVVMELADSNLKARFQEARRAGLPGIPREELLGYLQEAADALDYLTESHSLQHLDVKPENLLMVSRHVKVGDFGLLKQLRDTSVSLISGLTPAYASPEVFDGRADPRSDQYSLAVVYQEMATGLLPFRGESAASLAAQHLHGDPDLSGLTPQERFAVGKALSKDPARRFGSCRELVARLAQRSSGAVMTGLGPRPAVDARAGSADGEPAAAPVHDGQTTSLDARQATSLPALSLEWEMVPYRPSVFIGVGGTGGRVLCRLRQLLTDRFGDSASWPAVRLLWIDTDVASLESATSRDGQKGLREQETLAAPLRQSWHYRNGPLGNLASVSRRWIYNIPRTLRTEGLRALGRLALLDHAEPILDALRSAITSAADPEAVASTARHTGLAFEQTDPRVFVVASIAGGTGGGMTPDLAYAVRQVLAEQGFSDTHLCGILAYSTRSGDSGRSLAAASAYACLREMHYFSLPGSEYPGEPACKLAGFRGAGPAFANTYLVDFGDNVTDAQFAQNVDRLAAYLLLSSVSPASGFFDYCRNAQSDQDAPGEFPVRTVGLTSLGTDTQAIPSDCTETLCRLLARRWQGEADLESPLTVPDYARLLDSLAPADPPHNRHENAAAGLPADFRVTPELLIEGIRKKLGSLLGEDVEAFLTRIISEGLSADRPFEEIACRLHAIAGVQDNSGAPPADRLQSLRDLGACEAAKHGKEVGEGLGDRLLRRVNEWEIHLTGARQAADAVVARLDAIESGLRQQLHCAETHRAMYLTNLRELAGDAKAKRPRRQDPVAEHLPGYAAPIANEILLELASRAARSIRSSVAACSEQLRDLWKDLNRLSEEFTVADPADVPSDAPAPQRGPSNGFFGALAEMFAGQREAMVVQLDREVRAAFFAGERRLSDLSSGDSSIRAGLVAQMRVAARKVLLRCVRDADLARLSEALAGNGARGISAFLQSCRDSAAPKLLNFSGGAKRLLLAVPDRLNSARLGEEVYRMWGDQPTLVPGGWHEAVLCYEAQSLAVDRVCNRFLQSRPDCRELAARLHTRVDVGW